MTGVCHSKRNAAGLFLKRFPFDKINIDRCFVNDNAGFLFSRAVSATDIRRLLGSPRHKAVA
jgi:predicted signal transduction protein with EAL and GGDEF domain